MASGTGEDPLSDYFDNGVMGFLGGGLGNEQELSNKPYPVNLELNEWKSLPLGSFRLSVVSHRVTVQTGDHPYALGAPAIPLRSNEVEFQVVKADPEWQAAQLAAGESCARFVRHGRGCEPRCASSAVLGIRSGSARTG